MKKLMRDNEYDEAFLEIKEIILNARQRIYSNINNEIVLAYWKIGKIIAEKQKNKDRAEYGEKLISQLSEFLTKEFGRGFNVSNLTRMRKFYFLFEKVATVSQQLSWSHFVKIITIEEDKKREFYINECITNNWS